MSYNLEAGRSQAQIDDMKQLLEKGECFMCYKSLTQYKNNRIEFETKHWIVTPNAYPYKHTKLHLLLISRRHVSIMSELTKEERADFTDAIVEIEKRHKLKYYSVAMRNGDFRYTGASVEHLHAHIIVGDHESDEFEPVRVKLASKPKS
jgi:ATP adenylyltransferase